MLAPTLYRRLGGGGAAQDPGLLPYLELRLSGASLSGAADDLIASWADSSGNGRNAAQGTDLLKPRMSGVNANNPNAPTGRRGASFNFGENDNMTGSLPGGGVTLARGYTFYAWIFDSPFATINQAFYDVALTERLVYAGATAKIGFVDSGGAKESGTNFSSGYHFLTFVFYPPNGTGVAKVYQDGVLLLTTTWSFTQGAASGYTLGNHVLLTAPFGGIVYELDFFSQAHELATIQRVMTWGKGFWGF